MHSECVAGWRATAVSGTPNSLTSKLSSFPFFAGALGGALNSVAGGGSFIAFPALLFTGVPPIPANATNTIALWTAAAASGGAYRNARCSAARDDSAAGGQFGGRVTRSVSAIEDAGTDFHARVALADAGRDAAVRFRQEAGRRSQIGD
jgi:hypothetical protein